jgi:oxygen-independent coproporphyrinogen-3 oxidase
LPEQDYIAALLRDLDAELDAVQDRQLVSIFFGGGTPSLFSASGINQLLDAVRQRIAWQDAIEITLEANPGTVDEQRFHGFRQAGINRLSIGVQSFDDLFLQRLGRIHSAGEAQRAVAAARAAGFDAINLDLMYGLPGQDSRQSLADLRTAIALEPGHLSWYELTLEPNTEFYRRPPQLPQELAMDSIELSGRELLHNAGYQRYEISAYARPGREAKHNCNYWQFGDYLGIGAGAHSKLSHVDGNRIERKWKTRMPAEYMAGGITEGRQQLAGRRALLPEQLPVEFLMNALRLTQGVSGNLYTQRTGVDVAQLAPTLRRLREQGLLESDTQSICTTAKGSQFLDSVLQAFMPD